LIFLNELFSQPRDKEIAGFVKVVLPQVLIKTVYEKNFIVQEAKKSMQGAVKSCTFPETIDVLVEGCLAKNLTLAELSIGYLATLV